MSWESSSYDIKVKALRANDAQLRTRQEKLCFQSFCPRGCAKHTFVPCFLIKINTYKTKTKKNSQNQREKQAKQQKNIVKTDKNL